MASPRIAIEMYTTENSGQNAAEKRSTFQLTNRKPRTERDRLGIAAMRVR